MAALTTSAVTSVRAVRGAKANFAGSKAAFAAPARATVSSRASLTVKAANRELWCVSACPRTRRDGVDLCAVAIMTGVARPLGRGIVACGVARPFPRVSIGRNRA